LFKDKKKCDEKKDVTQFSSQELIRLRVSKKEKEKQKNSKSYIKLF
jgi:hypothetical protein